MPEPSFNWNEFQACSAIAWIARKGIVLDGRPIDFKQHPYQIGPFKEKAPRQCTMKGAQLGWTSLAMLRSIHGLLHGYYPQGVLYLFPSREDTTDFSKGRFQPLINDNPTIAALVQDTDAAIFSRTGPGSFRRLPDEPPLFRNPASPRS